MKGRVLFVLSIFLASLLSPALMTGSAENSTGIHILHTAVNPSNNHTYHLLSASSWEDAAEAANGLDGFLTTINDADENQWVFDSFANFENQSRHLWIGLSDSQEDGFYKWHDGAPFYYNSWGDSQPSEGGDEDYVHIAGTNIGNILPGTWNDLNNNPELVPVYGVVEVGAGADFSLRFNGNGDHIEIPHDDGLNISNSLYISAMIHPYTTDGIQFITMKGDYGWGMYLNGGQIGYASDYSLAKHPLSNNSVPSNTWTHIEIDLIENVGGEFRINGIPAGNISSQDAMIPQGDFGSNDCFTSGDSCDELYIGSMGAGCECNYFEGILDNVSIGTNATNSSETLWISNWTFSEGEGDTTLDQLSREGVIFGADWVMPDGTIVTQAVELFNEESFQIDFANAGDQLLFYADLDDMTKLLYFSLFGGWNFEKELSGVDVYFGHEYIPSSWEHDYHYYAEYTYMFEEWSWPDSGVWWIVIIPENDIEDLSLTVTWEVADPPPALDEMTELFNGIPVTSQSIDVGRQAPLEDRTLYYYVNVTEPLGSLSVETYGGTGNVNLGLSWGTVPDPFDQWFDGFEEEGMTSGESSSMSKMAWDGGPGNDETVTLYDIEPGMYYITAFSFQRALDFTIKASFTYAPENIEPEDAIELTPGVAYGPISGYDGLLQYFKIDVPAGTERIEVDLSEGYGEATLFMRYLEAPDAANFDHLSGTPGAGDMIGFNDPTPGMWYILAYTEEIFANVMITASFEDRYVWSYDGTPIQLFNGEEVNGIEAPAGEELFFYVELEEPGIYLEVSTFGGDGILYLEGDGNRLVIEWEGEEGMRPGGRQTGTPEMEFISEDFFIQSEGSGTEHSFYVSMPANGRFDISLIAKEQISNVGIVANWEYSDIPPLDDIDDENSGDELLMGCDELAEEILVDGDSNGDGTISQREFQAMDTDEIVFSEIDLNDDEELEYREILQETCSCGNELLMTFEALEEFDRVSVKEIADQTYLNDFDFKNIDTDFDGQITYDEIEINEIVCESTFDAFDGDRDGVPDDEDAFPNDPDESVDTDGDGVGDNADIAPSVANDVIYSAGAVVFLMLIGVLVLFLRSGSNNPSENNWEVPSPSQGFDERMMDMEEKSIPSIEREDSEPKPSQQNIFEGYSQSSLEPSLQPSMESSEVFNIANDLFDSTPKQSPPSSLMGMLDSNGHEVIEYPAGSGQNWTRTDPTQSWTQKE